MNTNEMRELDAWIAENVFGWSDRVEVAKGRSLKGCGKFYTAFKTFGGIVGDYSSHVTRSGEKVYCGKPFQFKQPPKYTTDPAEAMMVLEKCAENGTDITVFKSRMTNKWVAEWGSGKKAYLGITETADTLPLAICLFAQKLFTK